MTTSRAVRQRRAASRRVSQRRVPWPMSQSLTVSLLARVLYETAFCLCIIFALPQYAPNLFHMPY